MTGGTIGVGRKNPHQTATPAPAAITQPSSIHRQRPKRFVTPGFAAAFASDVMSVSRGAIDIQQSVALQLP
jgi:hypothetical protein